MKPLGRKYYKDIEEQLETVGDCLSLDEEGDYDYCDGSDIFCQDGVCPTCNYDNYLKWITDHGHCETGSWDCPDEDDCPWKIGLFDFK